MNELPFEESKLKFYSFSTLMNLLPEHRSMSTFASIIASFMRKSLLDGFFPGHISISDYDKKKELDRFLAEMKWLNDNRPDLYHPAFSWVIEWCGNRQVGYHYDKAVPQVIPYLQAMLKLTPKDYAWPSKESLLARDPVRHGDFSVPLMRSFLIHEWECAELQHIAKEIPLLAFSLLSPEQRRWVLEKEKSKFEMIEKHIPADRGVIRFPELEL